MSGSLIVPTATSTRASRASTSWLRQDLPRKVERKFHLPVTVVTAGQGVRR